MESPTHHGGISPVIERSVDWRVGRRPRGTDLCEQEETDGAGSSAEAAAWGGEEEAAAPVSPPPLRRRWAGQQARLRQTGARVSLRKRALRMTA